MGKIQSVSGAFPNDSPNSYQEVLLVKDSSVGLINEEHKLNSVPVTSY